MGLRSSTVSVGGGPFGQGKQAHVLRTVGLADHRLIHRDGGIRDGVDDEVRGGVIFYTGAQHRPNDVRLEVGHLEDEGDVLRQDLNSDLHGSLSLGVDRCLTIA